MDISSLTSVSSLPTAALPTLGELGPTTPGSATAPVTDAQRKKAAAQFEAIFVRQILSKSMGSMMGGEGHTAGLMYGDMMTTVLAQKLSEGKGLGIGTMIDKQLAPHIAHPAHAAASTKPTPSP